MSVRERCDCVVPELSPRDSVSRVTCLLVTTCSVFTERVSRPPWPLARVLGPAGNPAYWRQLAAGAGAGLARPHCFSDCDYTCLIISTQPSPAQPSPAQPSHAATLGS